MTSVRLGFRSSARLFLHTHRTRREREKSDVSTNWFLIKKTTTSAGWLAACPISNDECCYIYSCCCLSLLRSSIGRRIVALYLYSARPTLIISVGYIDGLSFSAMSSFSRRAPSVKL
jgi:hypothetical protein